MIKNILLPVLVLFHLCSVAQKTDENNSPVYYKISTCKSSFPKIKLEGENNVSSVEKFLRKNFQTLKDERVGLKLNYVNESPGGLHFSFTQTYNGVEVYQSEVKVNIDRKNVIRSVFDNSENTSEWMLRTESATINSVIAFHPVTHLPVITERRIDNHSTEILEANGEIVFQHSLLSYFAAVDSLVRGKVFNPDPLTTSGNLYGAPYDDKDDSTNTSLDAQLQTVSFRANFNGTQFNLESPYVRVSDFSAPTAAPPVSDTPFFYFNRSQPEFEDVNAFYHISMMQEHIHSLGFNSADGLVEIDPHGYGNVDQSYFAPGFPMRIYFGDGGVDDAEDADACVHEYSHFVSETASPGSNNGHQRKSLDEGFGDYLAASYSSSISTVDEYWVFNWDGHNPFWNGRVLNTNRTYPDSLSLSSIYRNGEMWSTALFAIHNEIGRGATDSLILETHYHYAQNISMADAAQLLIDADTTLNNGAYFCAIYKHLYALGFVPFIAGNQCGVSGIASVGELDIQFFQNGTSFTLINRNEEKIYLSIMNINGQLISDREIIQPSFNYQNPDMSNGIYLVQVKVKDEMKTFKWCKAQ